jgi:integrase
MKKHKTRTREKFTEAKLAEWTCPAGREYVIRYASQVDHLGFYIGKSGFKKFIWEGTLKIGGVSKPKRFGLGVWPDEITLEAAIEEAQRRNKPAEMSRADSILTAPATFGELVDRWRAANEVHWRPRTVLKYENHLRQIPADWLQRKVSSINSEMAETVHANLAQDHAGVNTRAGRGDGRHVATGWRVLMKTIFTYAINKNWLTSANPFADVRGFTIEAREVDRSDAEIEALDKAIDEVRGLKMENGRPGIDRAKLIYTYLMLVRHSGQREAEILNLRWTKDDSDLPPKGYIDLNAMVITMPKGSRKNDRKRSAHKLPLAQLPYEITDLILKLPSRGKSDYLFPSVHKVSKPMSFPKTQWECVRDRAGLKDFHFHDMRHIFIGECCDAGVSVEDCADLIGDSYKIVAEVYRARKLAYKERGMAARTRMINERRGVALMDTKAIESRDGLDHFGLGITENEDDSIAIV